MACSSGFELALEPARIASFGLALPPLAFITWPTRKPNVCFLPARYCATVSSLRSMTSRDDRRAARLRQNSAQALRSRTMSSADRPESYIFANTSLAIELLIVPLSMSAIRPASAAGCDRHIGDLLAALLQRAQQLAHDPVARGFRVVRRRGGGLEVVGQRR